MPKKLFLNWKQSFFLSAIFTRGLKKCFLKIYIWVVTYPKLYLYKYWVKDIESKCKRVEFFSCELRWNLIISRCTNYGLNIIIEFLLWSEKGLHSAFELQKRINVVSRFVRAWIYSKILKFKLLLSAFEFALFSENHSWTGLDCELKIQDCEFPRA